MTNSDVSAASPDMQAFARRIAETRAARRMSLDEVVKASNSNLTRSHISKLENGRSTNPTVRVLWPLAYALGVSPAYLLGLDEKVSAIDPLALQIAALIDREVSSRALSEKKS